MHAASCLVYATRAVYAIFGWEPPAELDDLHERIEAADEELQVASAEPEAP